MLAARTLADVRQWVAAARGTWVDARREDGPWVVLAHLPEGRRRIRFLVAEPSDDFTSDNRATNCYCR